MLISRRFILTSVPTSLLKPKPVSNMVHGSSCVSKERKQLWREQIETFGTIEEVMSNVKQFYVGLYMEEVMTKEIYGNFNYVREISKVNEQFRPLVEQMVNDAKEFMYLSDCLSI
jgi:hypothetical protein